MKRSNPTRSVPTEPPRVAALYVEPGGPYFAMADVDPWGEDRDARRYAGPLPVVAHPPCARWCRLAALVESRGGARRGDDGGLFASALSTVDLWGACSSILEGSAAWLYRIGLHHPETLRRMAAGGGRRSRIADDRHARLAQQLNTETEET